MSSTYTDIAFTNSQPDQPTAMKLNRLRDDLSAAISSIGGYYTDTWHWTTKTANAAISGDIGINAASWSAATFLNISQFSAAGVDKTIQMDKVVAAGNSALLKDAANANNYAEYTITGAGVNMGTWRQYPVSLAKAGGVPPKNGANTTLTIYVQGASGGGAGTGDMTKAVYDTDNNGKVDTCDSLPWGSVTGKPTTIGDMLKSVYDTNANNVVDTCDSLAWAKLTGVPSTFPPTPGPPQAHAASHNLGGSDAIAPDWTQVANKPAAFPPGAHQSSHVAGTDQIPSASTSVRGLMPQANGNVNAFYASDGTQKQVAYTMLSGSQPGPVAHALSHLDNGSDPIAVVTTARTGLAPVLSGNAATYLNGTGAYSAVSGSVSPGTWTNLSLGTGWTAPTQAQYRVEVNGAVSTVYFRGMIQGAMSVINTTAFTAPAGAIPSMTRRCVLAGAQNTGTATDVASFVASVAPSTGVCTIYALSAGPFCWYDPSQVQQVYLDGLFYSL